MKKNLIIIFFISLIFPLSGQAKNKWTKVFEVPGNTIYSMIALDTNRIAFQIELLGIDSTYTKVVNEDNMYYTLDGGKKWSLIPLDSIFDKNKTTNAKSFLLQYWYDENTILGYNGMYSLAKLKNMSEYLEIIDVDLDTNTNYFIKNSIGGFSITEKKYGIVDISKEALYISDDTCMTWNKIQYPKVIDGDSTKFIQNTQRFGDSLIYMSVANKFVFSSGRSKYWFLKSTNKGLTWEKTDFPFDSTYAQMKFFNKNEGIYIFSDTRRNYLDERTVWFYIYKTYNGGKNWEMVFKNLLVHPNVVTEISTYDGKHICAAAGTGFVWSEDAGDTWEFQDTSYFEGNHKWGYYSVLYLDKDNIWLHNGESVYKYLPEGSSVAEAEPLIASKIYPNPVVSNNIINLEFENEISVKEINLSIIDASGKNVYSTILKINSRSAFAELPAYLVSGTYHAVISSSGFPISVSRFVIAR